MKILHVYKDFYPPVPGGMERHIGLICRFQRQWADVEALVCSRSMRTRVVERDGTRVTEAGEWGRFQHAPVSPVLPYYLRAAKADVVVVHAPMPTAEMGWLLARPKSKLIVRYQCDVVRQATAMRFYRPFQQRFLSQAEVIMPTSELYARSSEALRPWETKWRIVPLGIEPEKLEASPETVRKVQERFGKTFVLFSGVHRYYKGLDYLVRAAKDIQAPLVIAGDGFERPKLMALAEAEGASIHFPGVLGEEELAAYLQACTVFVFPSSARTEAFGISMLEAQAAGKPVVATKLGTGVELVNLDGVTGINVPPQDPQAIAAAVNKLLADAELRDRMGAEAKARVEREFRADRLARQEFELYQEVLARPAP